MLVAALPRARLLLAPSTFNGPTGEGPGDNARRWFDRDRRDESRTRHKRACCAAPRPVSKRPTKGVGSLEPRGECLRGQQADRKAQQEKTSSTGTGDLPFFSGRVLSTERRRPVKPPGFAPTARAAQRLGLYHLLSASCVSVPPIDNCRRNIHMVGRFSKILCAEAQPSNQARMVGAKCVETGWRALPSWRMKVQSDSHRKVIHFATKKV